MGNPTEALESEARTIFQFAGFDDELKVASCQVGNDPSTRDDTCIIEGEKLVALVGNNQYTASFDDLFFLANKIDPRLNSTNRRYFYKLAPDVLFYKNQANSASDLTDGGLYYRPQGTVSWQKLSLKEVEGSLELRKMILPLLKKTVSSRKEYDQLNKGFTKEQYGIAQEKAVAWLAHLAPKGEPGLVSLLIQALPSMSDRAALSAFLRLKQEGEPAVKELVPVLIDLLGKRDKRALAIGLLAGLGPEASEAIPELVHIKEKGETQPIRQLADEALGKIAPSLSPEDRTSAFRRKLYLHGETFGGASLPWDGEAVGGFVAVNIGAGLCLDDGYLCAQGKGTRFRLFGEGSKDTKHGHGYYSVGGGASLGNRYVMASLYGGAAYYPSGRSTDPDRTWAGVLGADIKAVPLPSSLPLGVKAGVRMNPEDPREGIVLVGAAIDFFQVGVP